MTLLAVSVLFLLVYRTLFASPSWASFFFFFFFRLLFSETPTKLFTKSIVIVLLSFTAASCDVEVFVLKAQGVGPVLVYFQSAIRVVVSKPLTAVSYSA